MSHSDVNLSWSVIGRTQDPPSPDPLCTQGAQTSLWNQVAQTRASSSCRGQERTPVLMDPGPRPNTNRAWQAFAHPSMLGEDKANINSPRASRFSEADVGKLAGSASLPLCPLAAASPRTLSRNWTQDAVSHLEREHRGQEVPGRGTRGGRGRS